MTDLLGRKPPFWARSRMAVELSARKGIGIKHQAGGGDPGSRRASSLEIRRFS